MSYALGITSRLRLRGVHDDLVKVVQRAIRISEIDFTVLEGVRSRQRQVELVKAKASKTMNSRHLTGHAVDLGALLNGSVRWDWELYFTIAEAVKAAAIELDIPVVWGGAWCLLNTSGDLHDEQAAYVARRRAAGKNPFLDGPHFELDRKHYP